MGNIVQLKTVMEKLVLYIMEKILTYAAKIFSGIPKRQIAHLPIKKYNRDEI